MSSPAPKKDEHEDKKLECGICLEVIKVQGALDCCRHIFCFECVKKWTEKASNCPICRERIRRITKKKVIEQKPDSQTSTPSPITKKMGNSFEVSEKKFKLDDSSFYYGSQEYNDNDIHDIDSDEDEEGNLVGFVCSNDTIEEDEDDNDRSIDEQIIDTQYVRRLEEVESPRARRRPSRRRFTEADSETEEKTENFIQKSPEAHQTRNNSEKTLNSPVSPIPKAVDLTEEEDEDFVQEVANNDVLNSVPQKNKRKLSEIVDLCDEKKSKRKKQDISFPESDSEEEGNPKKRRKLEKITKNSPLELFGASSSSSSVQKKPNSSLLDSSKNSTKIASDSNLDSTRFPPKVSLSELMSSLDDDDDDKEIYKRFFSSKSPQTTTTDSSVVSNTSTETKASSKNSTKITSDSNLDSTTTNSSERKRFPPKVSLSELMSSLDDDDERFFPPKSQKKDAITVSDEEDDDDVLEINPRK